jgi:hypothetical protein
MAGKKPVEHTAAGKESARLRVRFLFPLKFICRDAR